MNVEAIKALIHEAFQGLQRDEDCTLHQAQYEDDQGMSRRIPREEWKAVKRWDPETDWRDVPASALEECDCALSYLSPQSWHFYLPAYMERALFLIDTWRRTPHRGLYAPIQRENEKFPSPEERRRLLGAGDLPSSVVWDLTYRDESGLGPHYLERFQRLNEAQESAVVAFLEFARDSRFFLADRANEALLKYWAMPRDRRPRLPANFQWPPD